MIADPEPWTPSLRAVDGQARRGRGESVAGPSDHNSRSHGDLAHPAAYSVVQGRTTLLSSQAERAGAAGGARLRSARVDRPFVQAVTAIVRGLRRGEVVAYGEVAARAGYPGAARAVGNVLAVSLGLPWWRVVRANGQLAARSRQEQAERLRREGISIRGDRIVRRSGARMRRTFGKDCPGMRVR